jgi:hypothetical protein
MALPRPHRPSHATVVAYLALVLTVGGGTAYAATGGTFVLGKSNVASTTTALTRTTVGAPLSLVAKAGSAPLAVNSTVKVGRLNADLLDGKDSTTFQPKITRLAFTPLTPTPGSWRGDCYAGAPGIAMSLDGVVHLHGDVCASVSPPATDLIFTIPAQFRPSKVQYLTVDQCNATTGRIRIQTDGAVIVEKDPSTTAQLSSECFISLSGISYTLPY